MAYTTVDRLQKYLPLDIDGLEFNQPIYVQVIDDWSRYVDDYLSNVYKTPFPDWPDTPRMVTVIVEYLSVYDLYVRAGMASDKDDPRLSLWKRAHEMLDRIRNKEVVLAGTDEIGTGLIDTHAILLTGPAKGPMSFASQARNLGPPHSKSFGGVPIKTSIDEEL